MAPLHTLEDEIIARLQREMQMRHQPGVIGKRIEKIGVDFDCINRREAQPCEFRHVFQNLLHQRPKLGRARKIGAIAREVDAGENDFPISTRADPAHLSDHLAHGYRARIAAAVRNDAEGTAMVTPVLHLHEGARAPIETIDEMCSRLRHCHNIVDHDLFFGGETKG